jgi:hypothetical protein
MRRRREASVERSCLALAKARGWLARKMNGFGFRSWPDRLFLPPEVSPRALRMPRGGRRSGPTAYLSPSQAQGAQRFWVEFKRRGKGATTEQARLHRSLRARAEHVYVVDNRERFLEILEAHTNGPVV